MTPEIEHAQTAPRGARPGGADGHADELADLRGRLLETEQLLAELPDLRERSRRLAEIESSPLLRAVVGARIRAQRRARGTFGAARRDFKRVLERLIERFVGRDDEKPDDDQLY